MSANADNNNQTTNTKVCSKCNTRKLLTDFGKDGGSKGTYYRHECRACASDHGKILREIKKTVPPIPENHRCPICDRAEEEIRKNKTSKKSVWCADHDHKTNTFRDWICQKCNLGLGHFSDCPTKLSQAVKYIKRFLK